MGIVEKGKISIIVALIVGIRVFYIAYHLDSDGSIIPILFMLLIPSIMMVFPNWIARNILELFSVGLFVRHATDAKTPQNSAGAIKFLGWVALILIFWLFETSY